MGRLDNTRRKRPVMTFKSFFSLFWFCPLFHHITQRTSWQLVVDIGLHDNGVMAGKSKTHFPSGVIWRSIKQPEGNGIPKCRLGKRKGKCCAPDQDGIAAGIPTIQSAVDQPTGSQKHPTQH